MFSIAITAWSANVETNAICLSVNGFTTGRVSTNTPIVNSLSEQRNAQTAAVAAQFLPLNKIIFLIRQNIRHVNDLALERRSSGYSPAAWNERVPFNVLLELPRETIFRREFVKFCHFADI